MQSGDTSVIEQPFEYSRLGIKAVPVSGSGLLVNLPKLPTDKTGWPWTEETAPLPSTLPDGKPWPKITIVTPSYNQGEYIEETIRSVLLQNYPNLEYIVMDGGSDDGTLAILEKYGNWISLWRSEKDRGQTHAINKGFEIATGFVRGYLNSDDLLLPGALYKVARLAEEYSNQAIIILGDCKIGYNLDQIVFTWKSAPPVSFIEALSRNGVFPQPATFWTQPQDQLPKVFNERLVFCMDTEFWFHLLQSGYKTVKINAVTSFFRHHEEAKSSKLIGYLAVEQAGIPLSNLNEVTAFGEKLIIINCVRSRILQLLRSEIESVYAKKGRWPAFQALGKVCLSNIDILTERATYGLMRKLLFSETNIV